MMRPLSILPHKRSPTIWQPIKKLNIDGIIYPSSQVIDSTVNVVLFSNAARVQKIDHIKGSEIQSSTVDWAEDGPTRFHQVSVRVPKKEDTPEEIKSSYSDQESTFDASDRRQPTLKIDEHSIIIHIIKSVEIKTEEHTVFRHHPLIPLTPWLIAAKSLNYTPSHLPKQPDGKHSIITALLL